MMYFSAICVPLITLIIAQGIMFDLARFRFSRKKVLFIISVEYALILTVSSAVLIFAGLDAYAKWYLLIMVIPIFAMFIYISQYRDARDMFTIVTTIFISFFISTPAMWVSRYYGKGYGYYNLARIVLFALIFSFMHTFFRKQYLLAQDEIDKGWRVFSILPIMGSAVLYYSFNRYSRKGSFTEVLYISTAITLLMAMVYGLIFYMFSQLHEKYLVLEQKRILSMQNKAQWNQHIQFKEASEKMNRRWHDLRHTMQYTVELLESGDTVRAMGFLKDHMDIQGVPKEQYCHHSGANSILSLWADRSKKAGIAMEISAAVPEKLEIDPMELSALFANAIENAYISCLDLSKDEQRFIKVEARYDGKRLAIGVTNTCKDIIKFDGDMPISSKEGGGIGTRSMVYTVRRFHGVYSFTAKDGLFVTRFVLNV